MSTSPQALIDLLNSFAPPPSPEMLGTHVPMVMLVVYLHNYLLIPEIIQQLAEKEKIQYPSKGIQFLTPKKGVRETTVQGILQDLRVCGYLLDTAGWEECLDDKHNKNPYYKVKFNFYRSELLPEGFEEKRELKEALQSVTEAAFWSIRGYNNPYFEDHKKTSQRMVSLNFGGRLPLFEEKGVFDSETQSMRLHVGEPKMVWPRNGRGGKPDKTGDKIPLALAPAQKLVIMNNQIQVVPV